MSDVDDEQPPAWQVWLRERYAGLGNEGGPAGAALKAVAAAVVVVVDEHLVQTRVVYAAVGGERKRLTRYLCSACCDGRCFEAPDGMRSEPGHVQQVPECCATLVALSEPWAAAAGFPVELDEALAGDWRVWSV